MAGEMWDLAKTKLGLAIKEGTVNTVRKLLQMKDTDVLYRDRKGNSFLHYVCTMHRPYIINLLMEAGVDVNAANAYGHTALHITALQAEPCHVPDLMAAGINPDLTDFSGRTALQLAKNQSEWVDLYNKYEPGLRQAVLNRDIDKIKYLLHCWSACHLVVDGKDMRHFAANLTFHDIVSIIDQHRFSIMAVYAVLSRDYDRLEYAISRGPSVCDVNYLQLLKHSRPHHMLQHAIRQNNYPMVEMICDAGADLNLFVQVKEYFRGPLYFEALQFDGLLNKKIVDKVLSCNVDLSLKDERGRSALHYIIDRRNGHVSVEIVEKLLEMGISISHRDENGSTARDIAMFERRKDVIEAIDHHLIMFVRDTDMDSLNQLAIDGYDSIIVEYQYRDTWIFASGNTNNIVTKFVEEFPEYQKVACSIHSAIENGESVEEITYMVESYESQSYTSDMLLQYKDKGGRNALLKAVLHGDEETVEWLLERDVPNQTTCRDNIGRGVLHYVTALGDSAVGMQHLFQNTKLQNYIDFTGFKAEEIQNTFIEDELKRTYGMALELHCAEKYSKMMKIIGSKKRTKAHFERELKELKCPLAKIPVLFHRHAQTPLVANYTDLLFAAIDNNRRDIAAKIAFLGVDCSIRKPYRDVIWESSPVWLTPGERASHLGMTDVAATISKYGSDGNYWGLGVRAYVQMYVSKLQQAQ